MWMTVNLLLLHHVHENCFPWCWGERNIVMQDKYMHRSSGSSSSWERLWHSRWLTKSWNFHLSFVPSPLTFFWIKWQFLGFYFPSSISLLVFIYSLSLFLSLSLSLSSPTTSSPLLVVAITAPFNWESMAELRPNDLRPPLYVWHV